MLYRLFSSVPFKFSDTAKDLLESNARRTMIVGSSVYLCFAYLTFFIKTPQLNLTLLPVTGLVITSLLLSLFLLHRYYFAANLIWLSGAFAAVLLATMIFRLPDIILCLVLFPLFAVVTMGISIGLIFQFLTFCTLVFLRSSGVFPTSDWLPQYSYVLIGSTTTSGISENLRIG